MYKLFRQEEHSSITTKFNPDTGKFDVTVFKDKFEYFRKGVKDLLGYNYGITTMYNPDTGKIEVTIFKDGRDDGVTLEVNEWNLTNTKVIERVAEIVQLYYMTVRKYK